MLHMNTVGTATTLSSKVEAPGDLLIEQILVEQIAAENSELDQAKELIRALNRKIAILASHSGALRAQALAVKSELERVDPTNWLFLETGKAYPTRGAQTNLNAIYDELFIRFALKLNLPNPERLRQAAK